MFVMCREDVRSLSTNSAETSRVLQPRATNRSTSNSRRVSPCGLSGVSRLCDRSTRLTGAGVTGNQHEPAMRFARQIERGLHRIDLTLTADERCLTSRSLFEHDPSSTYVCSEQYIPVAAGG